MSLAFLGFEIREGTNNILVALDFNSHFGIIVVLPFFIKDLDC